MIAWLDIARSMARQNLRAHRIAHMVPREPVRQFSRPCAAGDLIDPRRKQLIDAPQNPVLLMQHTRHTKRGRSPHRRYRRITAKAHHNIWPIPAHFAPCGGDAQCNTDWNQDFAHQPALGKSGAGDLLDHNIRWKPARVARTAGIGGQNHPPATRQHDLSHGLRREHMPAGPTGCENQKRRLCHINIHASQRSKHLGGDCASRPGSYPEQCRRQSKMNRHS